MKSPVSRVRIALAFVAVSNVVTGLWALFAPHSWYADFPGRGLGWVSAFGAYNEHFIQDIGGAYLGFGALFAYATLRPTSSLARGAVIGYLVFSVPHFLIHVFVRETLDTTGYLGTLAPLAFSIAVVAWVAFRASELDRADNG